MTSLKIQFGIKFCQIDLDEIISKYWNHSVSENVKEVTFDLSITEWISTEEIAFLFGWIRNINHLNKRVKVFLPFPYNIKTLNIYSSIDFQNFKTLYGFEETEKRIERRRNRNQNANAVVRGKILVKSNQRLQVNLLYHFMAHI